MQNAIIIVDHGSQMFRVFFRVIFLLAPLLAPAGCASIPQPRPGGSDAKAVSILHEAALAHGTDELQRLHDVNIRFEGKWNPFVAKVQPTLVDDQFRGRSEERYLIGEPAVGQCHIGPGGCKQVYRDRTTTRVWYNDKATADPEVGDAAALVADNYRMFLLGPLFFEERGATVQYLGTNYVDGEQCDDILAELRPGLGNSVEDRVVVSIDRDKRLIRRLRISVDGLKSTRGAIVDVYLRDHIRIHGINWPTRFYEELLRPFPSPVHRWRLIGIDFDRSIERPALDGPHFTGLVMPPSGAVKTLPAR